MQIKYSFMSKVIERRLEIHLNKFASK